MMAAFMYFLMQCQQYTDKFVEYKRRRGVDDDKLFGMRIQNNGIVFNANWVFQCDSVLGNVEFALGVKIEKAIVHQEMFSAQLDTDLKIRVKVQTEILNQETFQVLDNIEKIRMHEMMKVSFYKGLSIRTKPLGNKWE